MIKCYQSSSRYELERYVLKFNNISKIYLPAAAYFSIPPSAPFVLIHPLRMHNIQFHDHEPLWQIKLKFITKRNQDADEAMCYNILIQQQLYINVQCNSNVQVIITIASEKDFILFIFFSKQIRNSYLEEFLC